MYQRDEFTHELISAYLDGELSPDELARVEQLLVSNDVHQQTLAELKLLAVEMAALPAYRLDEHFSQRVLETARQVDATILAPSDVWSRPGRKSPRSMRGWQLGISLVLAAALLLALFLAVGKDDAGEGGLQNGRSIAKVEAQDRQGSRRRELASPEGDHPVSDTVLPPAADESLTDTVRSATAVQDPAVQDEGSPELVPAAQDGASGLRVVEPAAPTHAASPRAVHGEQPALGVDSQSPGAPPVSSRTMGANAPDVSSSAALAVPLRGTQKILLVLDVELTPAGAEEGGIERALDTLGIAFDTNLNVPPDLQNALLNSRFFAPAPNPQDVSKRGPLLLVYVVARGAALDDLWQCMKQNKTHFARVLMDLAIKPGDMAVFQQLQQLAGFPAMADADPTASASVGRNAVAHRLMLPASWNGTPVAAPQGAGGLAGLLPDMPGNQTPRPAAADGRPGHLEPGSPSGTPLELLGGNLDTEALLVVRVAGDK